MRQRSGRSVCREAVRVVALGLAGAVLAPAWAQSGAGSQARPETITVIGNRVEERRFDVTAAVDAVDAETLRHQQLRVNLSEALQRVPGLVIQNRNNYAQDLQVSSRGFGARATFGVRGVRLIQDGIPLTMPDGQGQTALFDLDGARGAEVLRGPFAALYGNASGGVIHLFSADGPKAPTVELNGFGGSFGAWRLGAKFGGESGTLSFSGNLARFEIDGYRDHSAARRDTANFKLRWQLGESTTLTLIGNTLDQPETQDPLGLTQAQLDADRRQAGANAEAFNTRKSIEHTQGGLVLRHQIDPGNSIEARGYGGDRAVVQTLAIPLVAQGPTSSGGVVDLDRDFGGLQVEWQQRGSVDGRAYSFTLGVAGDRMAELRRGYVNNFGVQGALRRDETDTVRSADQYLIGNWQATEALKLSGGVRHSDVRFEAVDRYIVGPNPDDSGSARYSSTNPVVGALLQLSPRVNLFGSIGRGFETPTFVELAYRPDGQPGLNFDLKAATSRNAELGLRAAFDERLQLTATAFRSDTSDDVVSASSSGGRNTFTNADETRRQGVELALDAVGGERWDAMLAYTFTEAEFQRYVTAAGVDLSGRRIPGVPRHSLFAELRWRDPGTGLSSALEWRAASEVAANDANSAFAKGYGFLNWRAGIERRAGAWWWSAFVRVDNLFGKEYVGSVIVNEANQRYFEPAPTRAAYLGATARLAF
jgi:iron complex outermembrane receptor protein